jgi:hypothetical protein
MANSVPTLSGLSTSVTFLENTANAAPQIIDADVTFADADNNFDGAALTITGLLAEDTVAIRNQGTGAGQIGVTGSDLTFGGTVIGPLRAVRAARCPSPSTPARRRPGSRRWSRT